MDLLAFIVGIPLLLFYFLRNWIAAYDAREADKEEAFNKELRKDLESTTERRENHPEHDSTPSRPTTSRAHRSHASQHATLTRKRRLTPRPPSRLPGRLSCRYAA